MSKILVSVPFCSIHPDSRQTDLHLNARFGEAVLHLHGEGFCYVTLIKICVLLLTPEHSEVVLCHSRTLPYPVSHGALRLITTKQS